MKDKKSWTGERLETFIYNENTAEHLHRYAIARQLAAGKTVLDIACGEGYGANLLSGVATSVTGVDIDALTVAHAAIKYKKSNLSFLAGSADNIPCDNGTFDMVVSFETVEHLDQHSKMIAEIKRVLKPGGVLFISSPDKLNYSDKPGFKNPFHVKELYRDEFESLLSANFAHTAFLGQRSFFGAIAVPQTVHHSEQETTVFNGNYLSMQQSPLDAVYVLGLASDAELPPLNTSVFNGIDVLRNMFEDHREDVSREVIEKISAELKSSLSFRVGHFLLSPFHLLKKALHA